RVVPPAVIDGPDAVGDLDGLPVGRREDGRPWTLPAPGAHALGGRAPRGREDGRRWTLPARGTHVLVAGATGAGKGSVLWSVIRGLGPWVRAGLVELWVDAP